MSAPRGPISQGDPMSGLVARQIGRPPRSPWRVAVVCVHGFPSAIASPSRLDDGTPFPTLHWLTCPHLSEIAARLESEGACSEWARRAESDPTLADKLHAADAEVRRRRAAESDGSDACAAVGLAGQREALGVKCMHAHIAYALSGIDDPIGRAVIDTEGDACPDQRCVRLAEES